MSFSTSRDNIKIETSLSTYYLIKEAKNFSDAKAAAEQDGGHLAVFETEEESRLLWDEINQNLSSYSSWFGNTTAAGNAAYLRIGGDDNDTESRYDSASNNWKWITNNEEISMNRNEWGSGTLGREPDNYFDGTNGSDQGGQDSLAIGLQSWPTSQADGEGYGSAGEWNDVRDSKELYYLVEVDSSSEEISTTTSGLKASDLTYETFGETTGHYLVDGIWTDMQGSSAIPLIDTDDENAVLNARVGTSIGPWETENKQYSGWFLVEDDSQITFEGVDYDQSGELYVDTNSDGIFQAESDELIGKLYLVEDSGQLNIQLSGSVVDTSDQSSSIGITPPGSLDVATVNADYTPDSKGFASITGPTPVKVTAYEIGKETQLDSIKDYDGNLHAGDDLEDTASSYKYQGMLDVNGDGSFEAIFTNKVSKRWVTAEIDSVTGVIDFDDNGAGGGTRVVGIYADPLIAEGADNGGFLSDGVTPAPTNFGVSEEERYVEVNGETIDRLALNSQVRFQNDLDIDNLQAKHSGDYDSDGVSEVYWKTADGTAYLRALMHDDGNIRYANYQSEEQMTDYLTTQGHESVVQEIV